jgi:ATP-binding cassette, subfamily C, bacterial LapB
LLDEPTSDLDTRSEVEFVQRLKQLTAEKTLIVVTHRPAVIDACTRLIVIDKGGILMDGDKPLVLARLKQIMNSERGGSAVA